MGQPLIGTGDPYKFESMEDATPIEILLNWTEKTEMQQISVGMLQGWLTELKELEYAMRSFDYEYGANHGAREQFISLVGEKKSE